MKLMRYHFIVFILFFSCENKKEQPLIYKFTTFAGSEFGHADGLGTEAKLRSPEGITVDKNGTLYVTEYGSSIVRKITTEGQVIVLAGQDGKLGSDDGVGIDARFNRPHGITVDKELNVYVCDMKNCTIRKIATNGMVSTIAGIPENPGAKDGDANVATFYFPEDIAINSNGFLYVADTYNYTIREISPQGKVTTFAGKAGNAGFADGFGENARFDKPIGIAIDGQDNIYVADSDYDGENSGNCLIRKITPTGVVTTIAGIQGKAGYADGPGETAQFNKPVGIDVTPDGIIYLADTEGDLIRKIDKNGHVSTLGGIYLTENWKDGVGQIATFSDPQAISVDGEGNLFIADTYNNKIRKGSVQNVK